MARSSVVRHCSLRVAGPMPALRVPIRGIVRPFARAVLSTSMLARIVRIGFREGQAFRKGDILVAFDCRRQRAERRSAAAKLRQMQVRLENAVFLKRRKANSRQDVEIARAEVDEAAAKLEAIDAGLAGVSGSRTIRRSCYRTECSGARNAEHRRAAAFHRGNEQAGHRTDRSVSLAQLVVEGSGVRIHNR